MIESSDQHMKNYQPTNAINLQTSTSLILLLQDLEMLGSQMRLPVSGSVSPGSRHFSHDNMETSIQTWRDNFLNKYHEQARDQVRNIRVCLEAYALKM